MKILAISGSLRSQSTNSALLRAITKVAPAEMEIITYDELGELPHFSPDIDGENSPEVVLRYRKALNNANGVLICTPEYAHGIPGVLKNSLDWVVGSGEYVDKPVMALSASPSYMGGDKAHASLLQTLKVMNVTVVESASFCVTLARKKINDREELIDAETKAKFENAFADFAKAIQTSVQTSASADSSKSV
ncbi:NADPH-dependent FMN reductase [Leptospira adleri]|uniref:Flavoprotein n=1 Tax=Leptospira adleri TaxID=2023186 RepID=A0A2M9YUQ3_9LEPT|nr:NADPH-dependent FMN reductase [Leptospira adleri]PJZ55230.1 flavoprotein [Leptospira adleri]PJZ63388.1 flavoprotein [Leptospira adleri]TGM56622.1 NAD(P)H-dependent oxidoreductase [Leptospira adleri]